VKKGPDSLTLATANQAVEEARISAQNAEARYLELAAGPPADHVANAQQAVENTQNALTSAVARQAEVNSHPTPDELQEAQDHLTAAQSALDQARSDAEQSTQPPDDDADPASYDLLLLRKGVEQDRTTVQTLERELIATRMTAPFSGTVASIQVRPGDPLEPGRTAVTLARPGTGSLAAWRAVAASSACQE
jgi:HlyD family secretion protein